MNCSDCMYDSYVCMYVQYICTRYDDFDVVSIFCVSDPMDANMVRLTEFHEIV